MEQVSWKKPLLLAAFLLFFGTFVYWLEYGRKPKIEEAELESKKMFLLKDVSSASIKLVEGPRVFGFRCMDLEGKLCKAGDNSKWELAEPMKVRADDSNVNALLSTLNNLSSNETIRLADETPEKRDRLLKEYRLDAVSRATLKRVEVSKSDGTIRVLYLGELHPIGEALFALAGDGKTADETKVYLVPSHFKSNFDHDLTYWRDKKLMTLAAHQINSFRLKGTHGELNGARKEGQWILTSPKTGELAGDIENIDNLLTAVTYLSAKKFVSETKNDAAAKKALAGAKALVTLAMQPDTLAAPAPAVSGKPAAAPAVLAKTPEPVVLTLYEKKGPAEKGKATFLLYATLSTLDPVFELEPSAKERVDKDLKDLRLTKLVTSMERFTAKRLELSGKPIGAPPLVLDQKDGKWLDSADKSEPDTEKVQGLLDKLSGNRIKDFLSGSAIPTGEAEGLNFALGDEKLARKRELVFWKKGDKLYARDLQSKRKEVLVVDSSIGDALPWARTFFKKGAAPAVPPPGAPHPREMPPSPGKLPGKK